LEARSFSSAALAIDIAPESATAANANDLAIMPGLPGG
jgi:hypothetical protein